MANCADCRRRLTNDEVAVTRKLLGLGETSFYCKTCLAGKFRVDEATIDGMIRRYRELGCWLFAGNGDETEVSE
jgi:hypothetical protein